MPNLTVKKIDGTSGGSVVLNETIFGAKINTGLLYQAVRAEMTNSRQDTRDTKTRGEVAGGGRKPYRQKGTGRARQGTISAPHYRHGGIALGPHQRDLAIRLPKKARRAAIHAALSAQAADDMIMIIDSLAFEAISTKAAANLLKTLGIDGKALFILPEHSPMVHKSFRNIPGIVVRVAPAFSVRDVLDAGQVVFVKDALDKLTTIWDSPKASVEVSQ